MNIIFIDKNKDSDNYKIFIQKLKSITKNENLDIKSFENEDKAIEYIEKIKFIETKIFINGELYKNFIDKFQNKLDSFLVVPEIKIFTENESTFIQDNKEYETYIKDPFFSSGIVTSFDEIK